MIQFTFEVVPCLILGLFRRFFQWCPSILAQQYKGWVSGRQVKVGKGGGVEREEATLFVKTRGHQSPSDGQLGQRDTIPVEGRIPG